MNRQFSRTNRFRNGIFGSGSTLAIFAVILVLIVLAILRFAAPGALTYLASPVWKAGDVLSAAVRASGGTESRATIVRERAALAQQNAALTAQNAQLAAKVSDLTTLLGSRTAPQKGIVANVLARPPVAPYDVLVLDQGTSAGITLNARVLGTGGTPIGTITEVNNTSSRVTLYSSRGLQTQAWVGSNRIPLTLTGKGAGAFSATVLKDAGAAVGDGVYLPSDGAFPIGTVIQIDSDPSSPSVVLDVRPYTNPFSVVWVTVQP